jgi:hypothetical protein
MTDLLDRCSSPSIENDIRSCLNDLCQRVVFLVDQSITQLPSPVFKRKMETQITTKNINYNEEQSSKKKPNRLIRTDKKEETIEQELSDVKPMISTPSITNTLDYICDWENCRT